MNKSRILKKKRIVGMNYISYLFIIFISIFIINLFLILRFKDFYLYFFALFVLIFDIIYFILGLCRIYLSYLYRKRNNFFSSIIIKRRGILDISSFKDIELFFLWDRVEGIVVGHYSLVIFLGKGIYLFFDIKDKKQIIDGIKKYKKDILIVK